MDKIDINQKNIAQGIPVYMELSCGLICLNDITLVYKYDGWTEDDRPTKKYSIFSRYKANPVQITSEDYEKLKKHFIVI